MHNSHSLRRRQNICHRNLLCVGACAGCLFLRHQCLHAAQCPISSRFPVLFLCTGAFHDTECVFNIYIVLGRDCFACRHFLVHLRVAATAVQNNSVNFHTYLKAIKRTITCTQEAQHAALPLHTVSLRQRLLSMHGVMPGLNALM